MHQLSSQSTQGCKNIQAEAANPFIKKKQIKLTN